MNKVYTIEYIIENYEDDEDILTYDLNGDQATFLIIYHPEIYKKLYINTYTKKYDKKKLRDHLKYLQKYYENNKEKIDKKHMEYKAKTFDLKNTKYFLKI